MYLIMEQKFCQSCGMPLTDSSQFGTNADRTPNETYCHFCFRDGTFTQKCTMDEMIENCLNYLDEFNRDSPVQYTREQAREQMRQFFPHLKRWQSGSPE